MIFFIEKMVLLEVQYYSNGNKEFEEYYKGGGLHREDGPAKIYYYRNGNIMAEEYYKDGVRHRDNGPVAIYYYKSGNIKSVLS